LVGLLANNDPAARKYAEWTGKACRNDGLRYELRQIDDPLDVEAALLDANEDPRVHGIIVYYPIFGQVESFSGESHDDFLRDTVSYRCDVEGLCHTYRTNLYRNVRFLDYPTNTQKCLLPCTALAVVKILEHCPGCYDKSKPVGKHLEGKVVTVINRSEIVGRPLAAMLSNDGATVYSIDINSIHKFENGRLHQATEQETTESCVRKVSARACKLPKAGVSDDCQCTEFRILIVLFCSPSTLQNTFISLMQVLRSNYRRPDEGLQAAVGMDPTEYRRGERRVVQERRRAVAVENSRSRVRPAGGQGHGSHAGTQPDAALSAVPSPATAVQEAPAPRGGTDAAVGRDRDAPPAVHGARRDGAACRGIAPKVIE